MTFNGWPSGRTTRGLPLLVALVAVVASAVGFAGPSGADVSTVGGGAVGETVTVSLAGGSPVRSGPQPSVSLPNAGGDLRKLKASSSVHGAASQPFGGRFLDTAALTVATQGTTGPSGRSSSSANVAGIDALGGALTVTQLSSTCTSAASGSSGSMTLTGGKLALSDRETVTLPANPPPNTTYTGTSAGSGATFEVVLNEHEIGAGSRTVNAIHVVLSGSARGDIVIAGSSCTTGSAAAVAPTPAAPAVDGAVADQRAATPPVGAAGRLPAQATVQAAVLPGALPAAVPAVSGGAFGFSASVSLFGGPAVAKGPTPTVTLPAAGADPALTASEATGNATYGPAVIFESKEMKVSTQGTTGATGSSTSSASVAGVGPGPFVATTASSTCTSSESAQSGSVSFTDGKLTVSLGPNKDLDETDDVIVPIPASPAPNTSFDGKVESAGDDTFRVVFNEQKVTADDITVNAVHLFLLGPIALGELIIGQSRCGKTATATGTGGATGGGTGGTGGGTGSSATGGSGTGAAGSSGGKAAAGDPLAKTGIDPPILLGFALVALGSAALLGGRLQRRARSVSRPSS